ncbi:MAG: hypothetical protein ABJC74_14055 [Gemmatimonadota bacterium]
MNPVRTRAVTAWPALAAVTLLLMAGGPAAAQSAPAAIQLQVEDVQLAWCLDFLIDPALAGHLLPRGWVGVPASGVQGLPMGLTRTFDEDAKYQGWFPGRVCGISARASSIAGAPVLNDKPRKPPTVAWLQIAAKGGTNGSAFVQPMLVTNTFRIRSPLSANSVKLDDLTFEAGPDPDKDQVEDGLVAKFGGASISWRGYLTADTMPGPSVDTLRSTFQNGIDKSWGVEIVRTGGTPNLVAGLIGVSGKGDLVAALKASPIRLMGRVQTGGTASVTFFGAR